MAVFYKLCRIALSSRVCKTESVSVNWRVCWCKLVNFLFHIKCHTLSGIHFLQKHFRLQQARGTLE